jgi:predicted RNA-binding protein (virulence factor B family)
VDVWNKWGEFGYAYFEGSRERVLLHAKDCVDFEPRVGDTVSALVHRRRRDGKLQAFKVMMGDTAEEKRLEKVHATLLGS